MVLFKHHIKNNEQRGIGERLLSLFSQVFGIGPQNIIQKAAHVQRYFWPIQRKPISRLTVVSCAAKYSRTRDYRELFTQMNNSNRTLAKTSY